MKNMRSIKKGITILCLVLMQAGFVSIPGDASGGIGGTATFDVAAENSRESVNGQTNPCAGSTDPCCGDVCCYDPTTPGCPGTGSGGSGSDTPGSDTPGSDSLGSDSLGSDSEGSDSEGSDSEGSDSLGSDSIGSGTGPGGSEVLTPTPMPTPTPTPTEEEGDVELLENDGDPLGSDNTGDGDTTVDDPVNLADEGVENGNNNFFAAGAPAAPAAPAPQFRSCTPQQSAITVTCNYTNAAGAARTATKTLTKTECTVLHPPPATLPYWCFKGRVQGIDRTYNCVEDATTNCRVTVGGQSYDGTIAGAAVPIGCWCR